MMKADHWTLLSRTQFPYGPFLASHDGYLPFHQLHHMSKITSLSFLNTTKQLYSSFQKYCDQRLTISHWDTALAQQDMTAIVINITAY
jgi:hypothetical protein